MQKFIFCAFINRSIKELPGDMRTSYNYREEGENIQKYLGGGGKGGGGWRK